MTTTPLPEPQAGASAKKHAQRFVAEIDEAELTLRLMEIGIGAKRQPGRSARQILADMRTHSFSRDPLAQKVFDDFGQMARASIAYFGECINNGKVPS